MQSFGRVRVSHLKSITEFRWHNPAQMAYGAGPEWEQQGTDSQNSYRRCQIQPHCLRHWPQLSSSASNKIRHQRTQV